MSKVEMKQPCGEALPGHLAGFKDGLLGRTCSPGGAPFSKYIIGLELNLRKFRQDAYEYVSGYALGEDERRRTRFFLSRN